MSDLSQHALAIWHAAVDAVRPEVLLPRHIAENRALKKACSAANRILVVGAGKAGAAMSAVLEDALSQHLHKVTGLVNVPADAIRPLQRIRLHAARPPASNFPTVEGVAGAEEMLALLSSAGSDDVALCLISGGGSALLPAPDGVSLEEKQTVTKLLHHRGATIQDMNAVRKHLSRIKGGRLAQAFRGRELFSLIISDVVGDPLDVIASGPTAADSSTFAHALGVLEGFQIREKVPASVVEHLERGARGLIPETLKELPGNIHNLLLANNATALRAATVKAEGLGYQVLNLGSFIEGETREVATVVAGLVRSTQVDRLPVSSPLCILIGGETTVALGKDSGKGGRNQEFVLAVLHKLGEVGMKNVVVLSGGTDGEDGPTDAAGAVGDERTIPAFRAAGIDIASYLDRHDAYPILDTVGSLIKTGLTNTNVMDVRVILVR